MLIFKYQFLASLSAEDTVSMINSKICKIYLVSWLPQTPTCIWDKPNLFTKTSLCLDSSQFATFYQSLVNGDFFFTSVMFSWEWLKATFYSLFGQPGFCLNFYLKQKQKFPVWKFTENASFISFHEGIWSIAKAQ